MQLARPQTRVVVPSTTRGPSNIPWMQTWDVVFVGTLQKSQTRDCKTLTKFLFFFKIVGSDGNFLDDFVFLVVRRVAGDRSVFLFLVNSFFNDLDVETDKYWESGISSSSFGGNGIFFFFSVPTQKESNIPLIVGESFALFVSSLVQPMLSIMWTIYSLISSK